MTETKAISRAIEAFGGDFARWPDRTLARDAMRGALADRDIRAALDAALALDRGLDDARGALDAELAGATQRVLQATLAGIPRPFGRWRWAAAVAAVVTAAGLGSVVGLGFAGNDAPMQMVVVDPLVFGPLEGDDL